MTPHSFVFFPLPFFNCFPPTKKLFILLSFHFLDNFSNIFIVSLSSFLLFVATDHHSQQTTSLFQLGLPQLSSKIFGTPQFCQTLDKRPITHLISNFFICPFHKPRPLCMQDMSCSVSVLGQQKTSRNRLKKSPCSAHVYNKLIGKLQPQASALPSSGLHLLLLSLPWPRYLQFPALHATSLHTMTFFSCKSLIFGC